jgi:uncharacterized membrane protein YqhA
MKNMFRIQKILINIIALFVLVSGIALTILAVFHFAMAFSHFGSGEPYKTTGRMAIGILHAVDLFLVAIVFFVLSIGIQILFMDPEADFPLKLPNWLHVESFVELKIILWEAILTVLIVDYVGGLAEKKFNGEELDIYNLILPGAVLLISLSLFFVKKEGKSNKKP